ERGGIGGVGGCGSMGGWTGVSRFQPPPPLRVVPWLVVVVPGKRGCPQANRVPLTSSRRRDNSCGDDFGGDFRLARLVKLAAGSLESFTHDRYHLRSEGCRLYEWTYWHSPLPTQLSARPTLENGRRGESSAN